MRFAVKLPVIMSSMISIGEILIDLTPKKVAYGENALFERNPGGAPANVAVQAAKLGSSASFIGKVGRDAFGSFLRDTLNSHGVDTNGLAVDCNSDTTLAFVQLDVSGDRNFTFYRRGTADTRLVETDIDFAAIDACNLLHFGSLSFTDEPSKSTTLKVVSYAKNHEHRKIISYDPNWRPKLWKNEAEGIAGMKLGLPYCDILKVSDDELRLLTGYNEIADGVRKLQDSGIAIIVVTMGPEGCYVAHSSDLVHVPTYDVKVVDTTGSGDSFFGAFLHRIIQGDKAVTEFTTEELVEFAHYANAAGALCATKFGAIPAMPSSQEIEEIVAQKIYK